MALPLRGVLNILSITFVCKAQMLWEVSDQKLAEAEARNQGMGCCKGKSLAAVAVISN